MRALLLPSCYLLFACLLLFSTCAVDGARTNFDVVGINLDGALPSNFSLVNFKTGANKVLAQVPPVSSNMGFNGAVFAVSDQLFIISYSSSFGFGHPSFVTSINPFTGAVKANVTIQSDLYGLTGLQWDEDSRLVYGFAWDISTWKFVSCNPFTGVTKTLWDSVSGIVDGLSSTFDAKGKRYFASYSDFGEPFLATISLENPSQAQRFSGVVAATTDLAYDATTDLISTNYFNWDGQQWQFYFAVVDASNVTNVAQYNLSNTPQGQVQYPYFNPGVAANGHFFSPVTLLQSNGLNTGIWTLDEATGQIVDFLPTETSFTTCCVSWTTSS